MANHELISKSEPDFAEDWINRNLPPSFLKRISREEEEEEDDRMFGREDHTHEDEDQYMSQLGSIWSRSEREFFQRAHSVFAEMDREFEIERRRMHDDIKRMFGEFPEEPRWSSTSIIDSLAREQPVEIAQHRSRVTGKPNISSVIHSITDWGNITLRFPGIAEMEVSLDFTGTGRPTSSSFSLTERRNMFGEREGSVTLRGKSKFEHIPVIVQATLDLNTFRGIGKAEPLPNQAKKSRSIGSSRGNQFTFSFRSPS